MIAEWMLYCLLASFGLAIAATLAERVLLAGRGPVRLVWICAVALSLAIPVFAYRYSSRDAVPADTLSAGEIVPDAQMVAPAAPTNSAIAPRFKKSSTTITGSVRNWRAILNRYDQPLIIVWATLSFALACNFLASVFVLMWMRRSWQRQTLQGFPVFLSERSGPAVVGAISPVIVLPRWALGLAPQQLELMLRHEEQHRLAGDGQLLAIARLALIVMPWNLALWWQILRLRVAVELDCDARVLQSADARLYGDLLLEVASTGKSGPLLGATAFAERATQLERRIRVLSRHRVRTSGAARAIAIGVGVVVLTVAWVAPHPAVPSAAVTPNSVTSTTVTTPPAPNAAVPQASADSALGTKPVPHANASAPTARPDVQLPRRSFGTATITGTATADANRFGPTSITGSVIIEANRQALERQADSALAILFDGTTLTPSQLAAARQLIVVLQTRQASQNVTFQLQRTLAQSSRDSALRALLPETERALLNARLLPGARGARGGGTGALPDTTMNGAAGGGGRGGGGGGRGGGPAGRGSVDAQLPGARGNANGLRRGGVSTPQQLENAAEANFRRLFDGIALTPSQDSVARAVILKHLQVITTAPQPPALFRVNLQSRTVAVAAPKDLELIDIATNASDKALVRSRLIPVPPR